MHPAEAANRSHWHVFALACFRISMFSLCLDLANWDESVIARTPSVGPTRVGIYISLNISKFQHITSILNELHWLSIKQ